VQLSADPLDSSDGFLVWGSEEAERWSPLVAEGAVRFACAGGAYSKLLALAHLARSAVLAPQSYRIGRRLRDPALSWLAALAVRCAGCFGVALVALACGGPWSP